MNEFVTRLERSEIKLLKDMLGSNIEQVYCSSKHVFIEKGYLLSPSVILSTSKKELFKISTDWLETDWTYNDYWKFCIEKIDAIEAGYISITEVSDNHTPQQEVSLKELEKVHRIDIMESAVFAEEIKVTDKIKSWDQYNLIENPDYNYHNKIGELVVFDAMIALKDKSNNIIYITYDEVIKEYVLITNHSSKVSSYLEGMRLREVLK